MLVKGADKGKRPWPAERHRRHRRSTPSAFARRDLTSHINRLKNAGVLTGASETDHAMITPRICCPSPLLFLLHLDWQARPLRHHSAIPFG